MSTPLSPLSHRHLRSAPRWQMSCEDHNHTLRAELHQLRTAHQNTKERANRYREVAERFRDLTRDLLQELPVREWPEDTLDRFLELDDQLEG